MPAQLNRHIKKCEICFIRFVTREYATPMRERENIQAKEDTQAYRKIRTSIKGKKDTHNIFTFLYILTPTKNAYLMKIYTATACRIEK